MHVDKKYAIAFLLFAFLILPMAASAYPVMAQDGPDEIIELLLTEGAEILVTNIDENGAPAVIYAQLGTPVEALDLEAEMYENCLVLAVIATRGELLDYIFSLIGEDFMGGGEQGFMLSQFDEGFTPEAILDLLGSDFSLLISAYYNLDEAVAIGKMGQVLTHLANPTVFGFSFADIIHLRIDEDFFGEGFEVELPFEALDVFMYQVTNPFADALDAVLGGLDNSGILGNIDSGIFLAERGAAAGLLAIPDMGDLVELFNNTMGGGGFSLAAESFFPSQFEMIDGSIAVAAVGYIGEQIVSYGDTDLSIGSLVGATGSFSPMDDGISIVMAMLPGSSNITGFSPDDEGLVMHDNESNMVMWNASGLGPVSDYIIEFESDDFPPNIVIERTFNPVSTVPGGSVEVTVTVTNNGTVPIENVVIVDDGVGAIYGTVAIAGTTSQTVASIAGGASASITYSVTFENEGKYTFPNAELTYEFNAREYAKDTVTDGYEVAADPVQLLTQMILDGMPISGAILGIVALGALFNINKMRKGGSSGGYQV
ncbi:MAG: DUF11 domain-containing protein [Candidatus Thorarchaeota archaeon]|nr:DUF11 domain-containing protein [Candidatus Thorarchaeota archaeon]